MRVAINGCECKSAFVFQTEAYLDLHFKKSLYEKFRIKTLMPFYHTVLRIYSVLCSHLLLNREKRRMMAETEHKFYNMK